MTDSPDRLIHLPSNQYKTVQVISNHWSSHPTIDKALNMQRMYVSPSTKQPPRPPLHQMTHNTQ